MFIWLCTSVLLCYYQWELNTKKLACCAKCELKQNASPCSWAQLVISFIQSCVSQSVETLPSLAFERQSRSRMLLSCSIMIISPVANEPVYLLNVPNRCFWSITSTVLFCFYPSLFESGEALIILSLHSFQLRACQKGISKWSYSDLFMFYTASQLFWNQGSRVIMKNILMLKEYTSVLANFSFFAINTLQLTLQLTIFKAATGLHSVLYRKKIWFLKYKLWDKNSDSTFWHWKQSSTEKGLAYWIKYLARKKLHRKIKRRKKLCQCYSEWYIIVVW